MKNKILITISFLLLNTLFVFATINTDIDLQLNKLNQIKQDINKALNPQEKSQFAQISQDYQNNRKKFTESVKFWRVLKYKNKNFNEKITFIRNKAQTLQSQISLINANIQTTNLKINSLERQISQLNVNLATLLLDLQKIIKISQRENKRLLSYILTLNNKNRLTSNIKKTGPDNLKLLIAENSIQSFWTDKKLAQVVYNTSHQLLAQLLKTTKLINQKRKIITNKQNSLATITTIVTNEKALLLNQRTNKTKLLTASMGEEGRFQTMLYNARNEQTQIQKIISQATKNLKNINNKITKFKQKYPQQQLNPNKIQTNPSTPTRKILDRTTNSLFKKLKNYAQKTRLSWPIPPLHGISAFFNDHHYQKIYKMAHHAIDIPTPQGTPIYAPATAYVYKIHKAKGAGYSYLALAHTNKLTTVYGHLSAILVTEGTIIKKGDLIGLTGGTPGSDGAGLLTSGPHLHFEVHQDGKNVDPLNYLPLTSIPNQYFNRVMHYLES